MGVHVRAAANINVSASEFFGRRVDLAEGGNRFHTWNWRLRACQDQGGAIGQRFAYGFKGFTAHDDDLPCGHLFEPLKVIRQVPGNGVAKSDDPVEGHRCDRLK